MTSFFDFISSSFASNSTKKLFNEILTSTYELQAKYQPLQLKRILADKQGKQLFIKQLSCSQGLSSHKNLTAQFIENHTQNRIFRVLKKLSVFHHAVIYYHQFAELIEVIEIQKLIHQIDHWLIGNIIKPYICFIKKYCLGIQMYIKLRAMPFGSKQNIFQCMCYAVNILKALFTVVSKLPSMGRYFMEKYPKTSNYFVQLMAYHSQLIYQGFRTCISQIIAFSKDYLETKQDQQILKQILRDDLSWINEQMKKLFLDKYFYPYAKGYGVKLYKIQDQNQYQLQIIDGVLNNHEKTQRQKHNKMMEQSLFSGNLNHQDLEKSFSFSLSKLQNMRKNNLKQIVDPEHDSETNQNKLEMTLPLKKLQSETIGKERQKYYQNRKLVINSFIQKIVKQADQFVEDV